MEIGFQLLYPLVVEDNERTREICKGDEFSMDKGEAGMKKESS